MHELSREDEQIIGQCLRAASDGPFIPNWEFRLLFGMDRDEIRDIAQLWPDVDLSSERIAQAVNNALINLLHYPHRKWQCWREWVDTSPIDVRAMLKRLQRQGADEADYVEAVA